MRAPYDWDNSLLTFHEAIDNDHMGIFAIGREIGTATGGLNAGRQLRLIHELIWYVNEHFKMEENLMREHRYDRLREHSERHIHLGKALQVLLSDLSGKITPRKWREFTDSFVQELATHIKSEDRLLAQFLRQVDVEARRSKTIGTESNRGN
jgi:hemerythrin-like metal-binding protein